MVASSKFPLIINPLRHCYCTGRIRYGTVPGIHVYICLLPFACNCESLQIHVILSRWHPGCHTKEVFGNRPNDNNCWNSGWWKIEWGTKEGSSGKKATATIYQENLCFGFNSTVYLESSSNPFYTYVVAWPLFYVCSINGFLRKSMLRKSWAPNRSNSTSIVSSYHTRAFPAVPPTCGAAFLTIASYSCVCVRAT